MDLKEFLDTVPSAKPVIDEAQALRDDIAEAVNIWKLYQQVCKHEETIVLVMIEDQMLVSKTLCKNCGKSVRRARYVKSKDIQPGIKAEARRSLEKDGHDDTSRTA